MTSSLIMHDLRLSWKSAWYAFDRSSQSFDRESLRTVLRSCIFYIEWRIIKVRIYHLFIFLVWWFLDLHNEGEAFFCFCFCLIHRSEVMEITIILPTKKQCWEMASNLPMVIFPTKTFHLIHNSLSYIITVIFVRAIPWLSPVI